MSTFNTGHGNIEVTSLEILKDMNQDIANAIATGPQDDFLTKLENFNRELEYYGIESIDVTPAWCWKPGTYPKIDELCYKRLQMNKKANNIAKFIQRTRQSTNYLHYLGRAANELERAKYHLKTSGVKKDVNVDDFKEQALEFVNIIQKQCDLAYDATQGHVTLNPYLNNNYDRRLMFYLEITLNDLTLSGYHGNKSIVEIPLHPIRIVISYRFRFLINKLRDNFKITGQYVSGSNNSKTLLFPYISYTYGGSYGTVCLDKYTDDIQIAFKNLDFVQMSLSLMSWAQFYSFEKSNPYNNIKTLHYGLPKGYSETYQALLSGITNDCTRRLTRELPELSTYKDNILEYWEDRITTCNTIECQLKSECSHFTRPNNIVQLMNNPDERYYQCEQLAGMIVEYYRTWSQVWEIHDDITDLFGISLYVHTEDYDKYMDSLVMELFVAFIPREDTLPIDYDWVRYGINSLFFIHQGWKKKKDKTNEDVLAMTTEEIKENMLAWATSPGRSR